MSFKLLSIAVFSCLLTLFASADIKEDVWKISKEKRKLTQEVSTLFRKQNIKDADLDALSQKAFQASQSFMKARKIHPDLKALYKKSDAAQSRMIKAAIAKDDVGKKAAREEFTQARMELEKVSRTIPELTVLQKKAIAANAAVQAKKNELLAATPEGKELFDKMNILDAKIAKLRKQL